MQVAGVGIPENLRLAAEDFKKKYGTRVDNFGNAKLYKPFILFMGLFCGHYLVHEDQIPLNLIKCSERMADMKAIYLYAVPQLQQFFIPAFSREGVFLLGI